MVRRGRARGFFNRKGRSHPRVLAVVITVTLIWSSSLFAGEKLLIGVAANFILPFEEIARVYGEKTTIRVEGTYTSSGNLYGQIIHGAPYDLFLSADEARPELLFNKGVAEKPFTYARGKVVLWTSHREVCEARDWREALIMQKVKKVAIANPETAPYGTASAMALKRTGLWAAVEYKLVYAQTIAQAFQYAHTVAVDAGFCSLSSMFSEPAKEGCYLFVPEAPDVVQAACLLKRTSYREGAEGFAAFLASSEAKKIIRSYGYE